MYDREQYVKFPCHFTKVNGQSSIHTPSIVHKGVFEIHHSIKVVFCLMHGGTSKAPPTLRHSLVMHVPHCEYNVQGLSVFHSSSSPYVCYRLLRQYWLLLQISLEHSKVLHKTSQRLPKVTGMVFSPPLQSCLYTPYLGLSNHVCRITF